MDRPATEQSRRPDSKREPPVCGCDQSVIASSLIGCAAVLSGVRWQCCHPHGTRWHLASAHLVHPDQRRVIRGAYSLTITWIVSVRDPGTTSSVPARTSSNTAAVLPTSAGRSVQMFE